MAALRDIDHIIKALKAHIPDLIVAQVHQTHAADDDGLWWFRIPGEDRDIQIESSNGNCPFMVETSDDKSSSDARSGRTIEEVIAMVDRYITGLRSGRRITS